MDKKQNSVKILVACHKDDPSIRKDGVYMPIQVGKSLHPELNLGFQCDNIGENISEKNNAYCELTALYWAWKNLKNVEFIGLCHYRRYFDIEMSEDNIRTLLNKYDCIIPKTKRLATNIIYELVNLTSWEDVYIFIDELLTALPDERKQIYEYFYKNNKFTVGNMFIMRKEDFDEYCNFLFIILGGTEKRIKVNGYSRLRRVLGYLSEPLLGFWLKYKKMSVKQESLILPTRKLPIKSRIGNFFKSELAFRIRFSNFSGGEGIFFRDWILPGLINDGIKLKNLQNN